MANAKAVMTVALLSVFLLSISAPLFATDDSSAAYIDAATPVDINSDIKAGSSASFDVVVSMDPSSTVDKVIVVMTSEVTGATGVSTNVSLKESTGEYVVLSKGQHACFTVSLVLDRYAEDGTCTLKYTYSVHDMQNNLLEGPVTETKVLTIHPFSDSEGFYNKFLGVFPNSYSGVMGDAWFTAIASFLIILLLGAVISFVAAPVVSVLMTSKSSEERKALRRSLTRLFFLLFIVFGLSRSMAVYGIEGKDYDMVNDLFLLIYAILAAFIVWKMYSAFLDRLTDNIKARDKTDALENYHSFKPLFLYIGKILIVIITVFSVMGSFGFDLTAIITSAGLITLGITFGAQQILSQFFAGLLILTTRPFKKGDLIQLGTTVVYKVRKVNVMNTELENWDNSDITIVPNNTLTSSSVKNLTRDTLSTKLYVFVSVGYGEDIDLARKLMVEAANEHPHIIKDGSKPAPSTSFIDFQDSTIQLRLNIWIDDFNLIIKVGSDMRAAMFEKFNAAGISIDYPQIVVHEADKE